MTTNDIAFIILTAGFIGFFAYIIWDDARGR
jgi:hypothetical protein